MAKKRVLVLGAGLAGLSAARRLQDSGIDCFVFEKEQEIGGLCRSRKVGGFTFDCDGHLLHFKRQSSLEDVKRLLKGNLLEHKRNAQVHILGVCVRYPFQANFFGLPAPVIQQCVVGFLRARGGNHCSSDGLSLSSWIKNTFGSGISRYFMLPYNVKFWRYPLDKIKSAGSASLIPVPCWQDILSGSLKENRKQFGYNSSFWYPKKGGIASLSQALGRGLKNVFTGCGVCNIDLAKKQIRLDKGGRESYDFLVSTIPLPEVPKLARLPQAMARVFEQLRWNSILNINLGFSSKSKEDRHWVYFPESKFCFFRAGFYHNFSRFNAPEGKKSLYVEVSYPPSRLVSQSSVLAKIKQGLFEAGILADGGQIIASDINNMKYGYPIYDSNYANCRRRILDFLSAEDIFSCGRYGSWRYLSMEEAILDGRSIADRVLRLARP